MDVPRETTERAALIAWLSQTDPNGCYSDEDMIVEFGRPATTEELLENYNSIVQEMFE